VSSLLLQVDLPQYCSQVTGEGALNGLGYSDHHCTVDRLYNPTILACDYFGAGMRVTDIRNPYKPVEIGYFNPATTAVVGTGARPIIHAERGEIWFTNDMQGFYVVRFEDGIWPFKGSARCPEFDDYYYAQYNPGSTCPTANLRGIGKPAPGFSGTLTVAASTRHLTRNVSTTLRVVVHRAGEPVEDARVRLGRFTARTNALGVARLRVRFARPQLTRLTVTAGGQRTSAWVRVRSRA